MSTEEQERGHSIEAQIQACNDYCKAKGWRVVAEYREVGSGSEIRKRKYLRQALQMIKDEEADVIVVWRLDRLTRSILDFQKIIKDLGPKVVSIMESLDMTSSSGRLMANILISFAQYERESISERTKLGQERARKKGKKIGRKRKIRTAQIKKIKELRDRGFTYQEIAKQLKITKDRVKYVLKKYGN